MCVCLFCGVQTSNPNGFCSDECFEAHEDCCPECGYGADGCECTFEPSDEDNFRDDVEADADVLRSAGYGTDEDYGFYDDSSDTPW